MTEYACIACHARADSYAAFCDACMAEDTIAEVEPDDPDDGSPLRKKRSAAKRLASVSASLPPKISTGREAWDIVLGGGLTRPSTVLVQGPKGVGKSTSALRIADHVSQLHKGPALYGSAEMPKEHVRRLGDLLGLNMSELYINDSGHLEDMVADIEQLRPILVVWDSIQRFYADGVLGEHALRDTVMQAKHAGNRVRAASLLLSQVTKAEQFVGSSTIGHDVDVVLVLGRLKVARTKKGEDDPKAPKYRANQISITCPEKNRFAATPLSATETLHGDMPTSPRASAER